MWSKMSFAAVDFRPDSHTWSCFTHLFFTFCTYLYTFDMNFDWRLRFEMWPLHDAWTLKRWPINMIKRKSMSPRICATGKMAIRLLFAEYFLLSKFLFFKYSNFKYIFLHVLHISYGKTATRLYWRILKHIYRYFFIIFQNLLGSFLLFKNLKFYY